MKDMTISELHQKVEREGVKGFLAQDEAETLWRWVREVAHKAPCLEIGSYCGKSTLYMASACCASDSVVFAVDHHRGSEEHQLGEEYHDAELYNPQAQFMDSFPEFRKNIDKFGLAHRVIPVVASSELLARVWQSPLSLVFVDGGHAPETAHHDCTRWVTHLVPGGILAVHDIFASPEDGGQGPYDAVQSVLQGGAFEWVEKVNSLGILRKRDSK